jgi:hypothetical protein
MAARKGKALQCFEPVKGNRDECQSQVYGRKKCPLTSETIIGHILP